MCIWHDLMGVLGIPLQHILCHKLLNQIVKSTVIISSTVCCCCLHCIAWGGDHSYMKLSLSSIYIM